MAELAIVDDVNAGGLLACHHVNDGLLQQQLKFRRGTVGFLHLIGGEQGGRAGQRTGMAGADVGGI